MTKLNSLGKGQQLGEPDMTADCRIWVQMIGRWSGEEIARMKCMKGLGGFDSLITSDL